MKNDAKLLKGIRIVTGTLGAMVAVIAMVTFLDGRYMEASVLFLAAIFLAVVAR